jgi:hypothetical protein
MKYVQLVDESGFLYGKLAEAEINEFNEAKVVREPPPEQGLGPHQRWKWGGAAWVATTDNRGRVWYDPDNTDDEFSPASPEAEPPAGWSEWVPGENKVIKQAERTAKQWAAVRKDRDARLAASDWVVARSVDQGGAVPVQWRQYRQALRDITQQADPFNIVWPTPPA